MNDLTLVIGTKNLSSWSLRPWLVARQFGIPFTEVVVELDQPGTGTAIRRHSKAGRVPVLHHGETTVWDSLAIVEYLAELHPDGGVWPRGRDRRAEARSVAAEMHAGFTTLRECMPMAFSERRPAPEASPALTADIHRVLSLWEDLRLRHCDGGPFLFGAFCAADAFYAPVVSRFRTYGVDLDGRPAEYADTVWEMPAMQEWLKRCGGG